MYKQAEVFCLYGGLTVNDSSETMYQSIDKIYNAVNILIVMPGQIGKVKLVHRRFFFSEFRNLGIHNAPLGIKINYNFVYTHEVKSSYTSWKQ